MVAFIRKMAVEQKKWMDDALFRTGVAFCQMVPGSTAMQVAAYVGLRVRGRGCGQLHRLRFTCIFVHDGPLDFLYANPEFTDDDIRI